MTCILEKRADVSLCMHRANKSTPLIHFLISGGFMIKAICFSLAVLSFLPIGAMPGGNVVASNLVNNEETWGKTMMTLVALFGTAMIADSRQEAKETTLEANLKLEELRNKYGNTKEAQILENVLKNDDSFTFFDMLCLGAGPMIGFLTQNKKYFLSGSVGSLMVSEFLSNENRKNAAQLVINAAESYKKYGKIQ